MEGWIRNLKEISDLRSGWIFFPSLQDFKHLEGQNKKNLLIKEASKQDEGVYTCVCTWLHSQTVYRSSGSRRLVTGEAAFSGYQDKCPLGGGGV